MVRIFLLLFFVFPLFSTPPFLKLEPVFEGSTPLYPGQTASIGYRYIFNTSIDLIEEKLPLLEAQGFKKLGDKQVKEAEEKGISVRQVTQSIEAINPGEFLLGPSLVSGYAYTLDKTGNKQHQKPPLIAELPILKVIVEAFPETGKPGSFLGAIGNFSLQAHLLSPQPVHVGEKLALQLQIKGKGFFNTVLPPELCCQPGFSGFFKESDLPPLIESKTNEKIFVLEFFLINSSTNSIPSIEFSFFDPEKKSYGSVKSQEIALQVTSEPLVPLSNTPSSFDFDKPVEDPEARNQTLNHELERLLALSSSSSTDSSIGSLLLQLNETPLAIYYFKRALNQNPNSIEAYQQLKMLIPETTPPAHWRTPFLISLGLLLLAPLLWFWQHKWLTLVLILPFCITGLLHLHSLYFRPIEAVIITSTPLFQGPDEKLPPVHQQPLSSGQIVIVLDIENNGEWLKVRSPTGMGYLPQNVVRLLP